ncbi:hypothetical protein BY458DRAFT_547746 [Sporodiniella umbellata]|nr:hypothetical protein BY458DRAFT_547746 [Sporodiniella umbellata]
MINHTSLFSLFSFSLCIYSLSLCRTRNTNVMKKDNPTTLESITNKGESPQNTIQPNSDKNRLANEKRGWDECFTIAEKEALKGNIVKAAKDNDGETTVTLQQEEFLLKNKADNDDDESQCSDESASKKPGRKPILDEEASDPEQDPKVKRKAQNRVAQRAFRERKERYVRELEIKLKETEENSMLTTAHLLRENHTLRSFIYRLEVENHALKGIPYSTPPPQPLTQPRYECQTDSPYPAIAPLPPIAHCLPQVSPTLSSTSSLNSPASPPLSKKNVQSPSKKTTQPLEYTFSISTPASLRSTAPHVNKKQDIEPVPLYPPGNLPSRRSCQQQSEPEPIEGSLDQEKVQFCKRLSSEIHDEALSKLLSEPLFDTLGKLNLDPFELPEPKKTWTAPKIWFALSQHPQFKNYTTEKLYNVVKNLAIYSDEGPVLKDDDMMDILAKMTQGAL